MDKEMRRELFLSKILLPIGVLFLIGFLCFKIRKIPWAGFVLPIMLMFILICKLIEYGIDREFLILILLMIILLILIYYVQWIGLLMPAAFAVLIGIDLIDSLVSWLKYDWD